MAQPTYEEGMHSIALHLMNSRRTLTSLHAICEHERTLARDIREPRIIPLSSVPAYGVITGTTPYDGYGYDEEPPASAATNLGGGDYVQANLSTGLREQLDPSKFLWLGQTQHHSKQA